MGLPSLSISPPRNEPRAQDFARVADTIHFIIPHLVPAQKLLDLADSHDQTQHHSRDHDIEHAGSGQNRGHILSDASKYMHRQGQSVYVDKQQAHQELGNTEYEH